MKTDIRQRTLKLERKIIDTTPLIMHKYSLDQIEEAYRSFENRLDDEIKIVIVNDKYK